MIVPSKSVWLSVHSRYQVPSVPPQDTRVNCSCGGTCSTLHPGLSQAEWLHVPTFLNNQGLSTFVALERGGPFDTRLKIIQACTSILQPVLQPPS